ncbi:SPOR domain-containing protein [Sphingomonas sp. R-74633]|uniref:SPOR domain-containing protein n=1 Tax=Sphingomonas sp. R-74633 TaxID=2751188 RepID=UPI0015D3234D|nr:SPOR domain-containing protein [Sphingomonas sp. R-74633]
MAAQAYGGDDQSTETWRAADGTLRSRPARQQPAQPQVQPAPEPVEQQPEPQYQQQPQWADPAPAQQQSSAPGASYAVPGSAPARQQRTAPAPVQQQWQPQPAPQQQMPQDYADPAAGAAGPAGSSQPAPGETPRYDEIGYAGVRPVSGGGAADQAVVAVHRSLPANSYVEVTSLDTGRTILVLVTGTDPGADHPIDLSAGAARLLGASGDSVGVRIRSVNPPAMDKNALQAGHAAGDRADAPQVLLTALRKRLPSQPSYASAAPRTPSYSPPRTAAPRPAAVRTAPPTARPAANGKYIVQVAALSNASRAQALAQSLGGFVKPGGGLYRVQLGPFATAGEADAARRRAAGAGYGDARVQAN